MCDPFAGLEHDLGPVAAPEAKAARETFPCEHCNGSGRWHGGRNRNGETRCFACKGRGHFLKSASDRRKARGQRAASKARKVDESKSATLAAHGELIEALRGMTDWNGFAASLIGQFDDKGSLSPNQIGAAERMLAKVAATRARQNEEREAAKVTVDLSPIRAMFDSAMESGLKRPTYRAEGLVISRAPDHGRNAGALYVKAGGEYQGKITAANEFYAVRDAAPETADALRTIAANPAEAAIRYGRLTGACACCGRELTKAESIERGIGPICAGKFNF